MVSFPVSGNNSVTADDAATVKAIAHFKVTVIALPGRPHLLQPRCRKEDKEAARMAVTLTHGHGQTARPLRHRSGSRQNRLTQRLRDRSHPPTKKKMTTHDVDFQDRTRTTI